MLDETISPDKTISFIIVSSLLCLVRSHKFSSVMLENENSYKRRNEDNKRAKTLMNSDIIEAMPPRVTVPANDSSNI
ncbi:19257_t:CDS:2 [Dentiscutata erythropus]|uniref:19257_t:CDS:1 n=1 Tax=Dentiscutata erythropus TaxID=1348616 RepID=A0A9N9BBL1_9GLOM|nr:19257_t:CDS:2 [Dentiscutata erythropus]